METKNNQWNICDKIVFMLCWIFPSEVFSVKVEKYFNNKVNYKNNKIISVSRTAAHIKGGALCYSL